MSPFTTFTDEQEEKIAKRKNALKDIQTIIDAMKALLDDVSEEGMTSDGIKIHPWLISDGDLSRAIEQWEGYRQSLKHKVDNLP